MRKWAKIELYLWLTVVTSAIFFCLYVKIFQVSLIFNDLTTSELRGVGRILVPIFGGGVRKIKCKC